ncbi:MAG TPA: phosphatidylserine decarboxylase [Armatimonadota bacterium]|jgi:phosphatidylserine decarboxylase
MTSSQHHSQSNAHRIYPGIATDGLPFIASGIALTGVSALINPLASVAPLALTALVTYFFRDPERPLPTDDRYLYAPADGRVMFIEEIDEPRFIKGPAYRIAIFLSIFNVHINRSPAAGIVRYREHVPGNFRAAWHKEIEPGNERHHLGIETPRGPIMVVQVAGLLARRIVCRPQLETPLACGERIGLIKFSSRTDLIFPRTMAKPIITPETPVHGGITPIGAYL